MVFKQESLLENIQTFHQKLVVVLDFGYTAFFDFVFENLKDDCFVVIHDLFYGHVYLYGLEQGNLLLYFVHYQ